MNGSLRFSPNVVDMKLKRGPAGLGFNIVGGVDQPYVDNDSGIFVSKIKEDGAAALDGRLEEGDKILAINGVQLEDLTHGAAVDHFRTAGEDVELLVLKKFPLHMNGPSDSQPDHQSSAFSLGMLAALAGAAVLFSFIFTRHIRKHF
ncbi:putative synaptojanin-2-binding protein [Scophthalmus maximus]|uniref:Synaptojanin-2-binding protein n=1 Tax=Scophthalmus maximus TaxID=52904 RepID=A0A2U9CK81_SCOMX|nr:synaptojanin-2-binding protein [Scophthalmus maximus]AWP16116.1 putative synaptojanin-2-binding protein [Scophthalmus maximus]